MKIKYEYNDKYIEEFGPDYDLVIRYNNAKEFELFLQVTQGIHLDIHDCIEYQDVELFCSVSEPDFKILMDKCSNFNILCVNSEKDKEERE